MVIPALKLFMAHYTCIYAFALGLQRGMDLSAQDDILSKVD
jgi:hypothetical protein